MYFCDHVSVFTAAQFSEHLFSNVPTHILVIIHLLAVVCISTAISAIMKKSHFLWCHHVPDIFFFSLSRVVPLQDLSADGQWCLAQCRTPSHGGLHFPAPTPNSLCCAHRQIFSHFSPIFSWSCGKFSLADLLTCGHVLVWLVLKKGLTTLLPGNRKQAKGQKHLL